MDRCQWFRKKENKDMFILVIISLMTRMYFYFINFFSSKGLPQVYDTNWYLEHAELFIKNLHIDIEFNGIFYVSYYSLLGVLMTIFKSKESIVLVQMLINAISVILVYKIANMLFGRRTAILSGLIYAFLRPLIFWSIFIITDSLFVTLMLLQTYFVLKAFQSNNKKYWLLFWVTSIYMFFFRPTGIITLTFAIMYIIINLKLKNYFKKYKVLLLCLGLAVLIPVCYFSAYIVKNPLGKSLYLNMIWLLQDNYASGQIYDIATPYDYKFKALQNTDYFNNYVFSFFINNWKHILILYTKRLISFVGVWIWKLDNAGLATKIKYLVPFAFSVLTGSAGVVSMIRQKIFKRSSIILFETISIVFFTVFFFMDSAYRYRVPALVFMGIICAYGLNICIEFTIKRFYKIKGMVNK